MGCRSISIRSSTVGRAGWEPEVPFKTYQCGTCGFIYDEAEGLPEEGFPPGTRWADIPDTWNCPDCSMSKAQFDMVEI